MRPKSGQINWGRLNKYTSDKDLFNSVEWQEERVNSVLSRTEQRELLIYLLLKSRIDYKYVPWRYFYLFLGIFLVLANKYLIIPLIIGDFVISKLAERKYQALDIKFHALLKKIL